MQNRHNQVDWNILDVEEEEWNRRIGGAALEPPAALPVHPSHTEHEESPSKPLIQFARPLRRFLLRAAVAIAVLCLSSYAVWAKATAGLDAMKSEVTDQVHAEVLRDEKISEVKHEEVAVQNVDILDNSARAEVVVTETLVAGGAFAERQNRFYSLSPQGWVRAAPAVTFWGDTQTLDTPHLHFVFGTIDANTVKSVAADAETLERRLQHIAAAPELSPTTTLTVEVEPTVVSPHEEVSGSTVRLTSPVLIYADPWLSPVETLSAQLRRELVDANIGQATLSLPFKPQWRTLMGGLLGWLLTSDSLPLAVNPVLRHQTLRSSASLASLLACVGCQTDAYRVDNGFRAEEQAGEVAALLDYLSERYGDAGLAALYHGMCTYDDWNTLAPAAFGISAPQLQQDWRSWGR